MKRPIAGILVLNYLVFLCMSCSQDKSDSKSMEQLHEEKGVPVRIKEVRQSRLVSEHTFFSVLTGIQESTAGAKVAGRVEKIFYRVGDRVEKDAVVASFPTDNPAAQYVQAKVGYEHARATRDRMKNLYEHGGISLQDFENAETQFKVAKANWHAVRQSVKVLAPIDGTITGIDVRVSDNVNPGDVLFTVSDYSKLKAKIDVSENRIENIRQGAQATARWGDSVLQGRVVQVDMSMNSREQAFGVHLVFDNPGQRVHSGVNAEIRILSERQAGSVVIERKNTLSRGEGRYVFVAENGVARLRPVEIVPSAGLDVKVQAGLAPGDSLIVEGRLLLKDGDKINIIN